MRRALIPILTLAWMSDAASAPRTFASSFESISDFNGFYIVPPGDYASSQEISTEQVHSGAHSHKAWILAARAENNDGPYLPHRAYPTIQFGNIPGGLFKTPCLVTLWVNLDIQLHPGPTGGIDDWFSFLTLTPDTSNQWVRVVVANLSPDGYCHLVHVPRHDEQTHIFQAAAANDPQGALLFPYRKWVRLDTYIDFDSANGYAKVWQNGTLVSHGKVEGGHGYLAQAHFGLYASAAIPIGTVYNDDLRVKEVADEREALALVQEVSDVVPRAGGTARQVTEGLRYRDARGRLSGPGECVLREAMDATGRSGQIEHEGLSVRFRP